MSKLDEFWETFSREPDYCENLTNDEFFKRKEVLVRDIRYAVTQHCAEVKELKDEIKALKLKIADMVMEKDNKC